MGSTGQDNPAFVQDPHPCTGLEGVVEGGDTRAQYRSQEEGGVTVVVGKCSDKSEKGISSIFQFTRRQWTFLVIYGLANVFRAASILIAGPFYPPVAEHRGVTNSEFGFVFGAYDFSTFLVVLLFGVYIIPRFGPRLVFKCSILNLALFTTLFGFLQLTQDRTVFLTFSFLIRILAGMGDAGFYPSAFVILAQEFEGNVSIAIGIFEFLFGVGAIGGPLIFGAFIDKIEKGFLVVYAITGFCLFCCVLLCHFLIPGPLNEGQVEVLVVAATPPEKSTTSSHPHKRWYHLFLIPTVCVVFANLFTTAASIGFITGTLEPHLEQFDLTTFQISVVFIISNTIYTVLSPGWGKMSDWLVGYHRNGVVFVGAALVFLGFSFMGPLPFLSHKSYLWCTLLGLALHGMGIGAAVMSAFPHASEAAVKSGFADTEKTYSLISSFYILTFTLGNAVGPSVSGLLVDHVRFQNATLFIFSLALFVLVAVTLLTLVQRRRSSSSKHG